MGSNQSAIDEKGFQEVLKAEKTLFNVGGGFDTYDPKQIHFMEELVAGRTIKLKTSDFVQVKGIPKNSGEVPSPYCIKYLRKFNKLQAYREYLLSLTPRFVEETRLMDSILQHMGMKGTVEEITKHFDQMEFLRIWQTLTKLQQQSTYSSEGTHPMLFTKS